jgi:hypothetical protein
VPERLIGHDRTEVGAADADVDDVPDALTSVAFPLAAPDALREVRHLAENGVDLGHHILTVHNDGCPCRGPEGHMQDGPLLRDVDLLAAEHGIDPGAKPGFFCQLKKKLEGLVGDAILRVIHGYAHGFSRHALAALRIFPKEISQMKISDFLIVALKGLPCLALGEGLNACRHVGTPFFFYSVFRASICRVSKLFSSDQNCISFIRSPSGTLTH